MDFPKEAKHAGIQFLRAEGIFGTNRRMTNVYGIECLSLISVFRWSKNFCSGRVCTADMPRPGQAHMVITKENIDAVQSLVKDNRRITIQEIAYSLSLNECNVQSILYNHLHCSKVCATWVPKHCRMVPHATKDFLQSRYS
ncbi:hypothetical protein AVEN_261009-1 [Araneus ventricosus]|uniref:Mos1 transposase HTH domain-containing protein n=1 Tax=Araneus ventricosus TaxID=182803 RepID=A0A4Y2SB15_ARAVE|nr:hypothetical protein AVEN_261009-1 [Araneus ventricosus]